LIKGDKFFSHVRGHGCLEVKITNRGNAERRVSLRTGWVVC